MVIPQDVASRCYPMFVFSDGAGSDLEYGTPSSCTNYNPSRSIVSHITEQPSRTNDEPLGTNDHPSRTNDHPSRTNDHPSRTNDHPSRTNDQQAHRNDNIFTCLDTIGVISMDSWNESIPHQTYAFPSTCGNDEDFVLV